MARRLSKKEKGFVNDVADGVVPTIAALQNYDTESYGSAGVIAHENLKKLKILDALKERGFNEDSAKAVVADILLDAEEESIARLNAADKVFKVFGTYAAEKSFNLTATASVDEMKEVIQKDLAKFRPNQ